MNIISQMKISNYFSHPLPEKKALLLHRQLPTRAVQILLEHFKAILVTYSGSFLLYKEKQKILRDTFKDVHFSQTAHHWHSSLETSIKATLLL